MLLSVSFLTAATAFFLSSFVNSITVFFISFFAVIVLNIEILSLFKGINDTNIFLITFFEFVLLLAFWLKAGRPVLKTDFRNFLNELKNAFNKDGLLIILFAGWLFYLLTAIILAGFCPVTEPDAQSYHALRALHWVKDGFLSRFETADERAICMPVNSEIFYTWLLSLFKKDTMFGLLQFFSYFLLIISNFKIMEFFKIDFIKRIWAILIFTSFAAIIVQIPSTQTDICTAALLSASILLVLKFKEEKKLSLLFYASLSMGLAFGVKTTAFIASIPLIVWFIILLKKDIIKFFALLFLNFTIFSSYNYILNFIDYGNFLSSNAFILYNQNYGGIKAFVANFIKYTVQFIDFSGLQIGKHLSESIINARDSILNFLSIPLKLGELDSLTRINAHMDEQIGGFGILGFVVFIPCLIGSFFKKNLRSFSIVFMAQFILLCALMLYTVYGIRYITTFLSLAIPVLSLSYFKKNNIFKIVFIIYALFYFCYASLFSPLRPVAYLGKEFIKNKNIEHIQNTLRDSRYKFFGPLITIESAAYKKSAEPYCKEGKKIGFFVSETAVIYAAKYMELTNDCTIDTLNSLHIENYNLKDYDVIFKTGKRGQFTNVINKNDLENPIYDSDKLECVYVVSSDKQINPNKTIHNTLYAECKIYDEYLTSLGFKKTNTLDFIKASGEDILENDLEAWVK